MATKQTSRDRPSTPAKRELTPVFRQSIEPLPRQKGDDWRQLSACRQIDPELFFPEVGGKSTIARNICRTACTVREECLGYALETDEKFGIWGGLSTRERNRLKREKLEAARQEQHEIETLAVTKDHTQTLMEEPGDSPEFIVETLGATSNHRIGSSAA